MFNAYRAMKCAFALVAAAVLFAASPSLSYAETGAVRITAGSAGFIVGVGGGSGTLTFRGRTYPLSIGGISVGMIGVSRVELVGRARNLRTAADIAGTYTAVSAGLAIAGGAKAAQLQNSNGVVLELRGRQIGLQANLDLSGLQISLR
ncbi:MAG TPA: hypothetical protein VEJ43_12375 [Pseudolabrys sp.]|nr:hypothetical protein [Pseudolabrys sp.]